jgi:DNA-binding XRE family transcriptional regulator
MTDETSPDVRGIRERAGLDQSAFGKALGVSERTVRSWEKGAPIPESMQLLLDGAAAALAGGQAPQAWGARVRERFAGAGQ